MFNLFKKKTESTETPDSPKPSDVSENTLSLSQRLKQGLSKTRQQLGGQLNAIFGTGRLDAETLEDLESVLLTADVGVGATEHILAQLKAQIKHAPDQTGEQAQATLKKSLLDLLNPLQQPLNVSSHNSSSQQPFVIMMVGVNGAGKTTTIGKLAKHLQAQGKSVLIAAGDTFRAAAREQLQVWGERNDVHVVASEGGDPAAVIYDAVNSAIAKKIDVVIADTAGRLPTQMHLMDEIKKVQRVIGKASAGAPHEVLLVLDANTGQNAVNQLKAFNEALGVTGLVLSKLDGTAKGGVIAAIAHQHQGKPIPVRFIGIGEAIDDLRPFDAQAFIDALFD